MRPDNRPNDTMRPVSFQRQFTRYAEGAVLVSFGETKVLCTASVEDRVPAFLRETGSGWITAEYAMLPRSTHTRTSRDSLSAGRAKEEPAPRPLPARMSRCTMRFVICSIPAELPNPLSWASVRP